MDWKPSRAKRRISSRPSHGFLARFRRSTRCAVVSFAVVVISSKPGNFYPENKKPTARCVWRWVDECLVKKEFLGQQPPRASAHTCTTTTSAEAHRAKILTIRHLQSEF